MLPAKQELSGTPSVFESNLALVPEQPGDPDQVAELPSGTFAMRFCTHRGLKLEEYEEAIFQRALYRRARVLRPLLEKISDYFAPDRAFIAMVGRAKNMEDVESAMGDFADCRSPYRFLRKRLKLRISASTVWMLTNRLLKEQPPPAPRLLASRAPFPPQAQAWRASAVAVATSNTAAARANRGMEEAEVSRLRDEVTRLNAQCELLKRAVGLFCETKTPPPSYT
jgi:hypothetical protein